MSFSMDVKSELARLEEPHECCKKSGLMGLLRAGLTLKHSKDKQKLMFITESAPLSRLVFSRVKELFHTAPEIQMLKTRRFKSHALYRLDLSCLLQGNQELLSGLTIEGDNLTYKAIRIKNRCCKRAYLRGGFLATGSLSDPDKAYHLEVSFQNRFLAEEYGHVLKEFGIESRTILRKGHVVVYLKEGQEIVDFLNVIGAHGALMSLENIRIVKDMRNQVNRIVNCETANLEKTVNAACRQVENIQYIKDHVGFDSLPQGMADIARLRIDNPDVSLVELGRMLNPPLSKSGVNHRLRKLDQIAEELRKSHVPG